MPTDNKLVSFLSVGSGKTHNMCTHHHYDCRCTTLTALLSAIACFQQLVYAMGCKEETQRNLSCLRILNISFLNQGNKVTLMQPVSREWKRKHLVAAHLGVENIVLLFNRFNKTNDLHLVIYKIQRCIFYL